MKRISYITQLTRQARCLLVACMAIGASLPAHAFDFWYNDIHYTVISGNEVEADGIKEYYGYGTAYGLYWKNYNADTRFDGHITYEGTEYVIKSIGNNAFAGHSFEYLTIPYSVERIGDEAFRDCSIGNYEIFINLEHSQLKTIGKGTFMGVPHVQTSYSNTSVNRGWLAVKLPSCIESIGENAFASDVIAYIDCRRIESPIALSADICKDYQYDQIIIYTDEDAADGYKVADIWKKFSRIGTTRQYGLYEKDGWYEYTEGSPNATMRRGYSYHAGYYTVKKKFTLIEEFDADGNHYNVTAIGPYALGGNVLEGIVIHKGIASIGTGAFVHCPLLNSIIVERAQPPVATDDIWPEDVYSNAVLQVPEGSVENYRKAEGWRRFGHIKEIDNSIGGQLEYNAVSGTSRLVTIKQVGTEKAELFASQSDIELPQTASVGLQAVVVTGIDDYAFRGCDNLVSVVVPMPYEAIQAQAFGNCTALQRVVLPASLRTLWPTAFDGCTALTDITLYATKPPRIAMDPEWAAHVTLHVPKGSLRSYQAEDHYGGFMAIEEMDDNGAADPKLQGVLTAQLAPLTSRTDLLFSPSEIETSTTESFHQGIFLAQHPEMGDSYDAADEALVLNSTLNGVTDSNTREFIRLSDFGPDYMSLLVGGIAMKLPQGEGTLVIDSDCDGTATLMVCVSGDPLVNKGADLYVNALRWPHSTDIKIGDWEGAFVYLLADKPGARIYGLSWQPNEGLANGGSSDDTTAIDRAIAEKDGVQTASATYYAPDGRRLSSPARGLNIVIQSDGTARKVMF